MLPVRQTIAHSPIPDHILAKTLGSRVDIDDGYFTYTRLRYHPITIQKYWKLAHAMHQKSLVPLVHGQRAPWLIPQSVLSRLGFTHCQTLRSPESKFYKKGEIIQQSIDEFIQQRQRHPRLFKVLQKMPTFMPKAWCLDHQPDLRPHLLATTIGLFHCDWDESGPSLVWGGGSKWVPNPGNRSILETSRSQRQSDAMVECAMKVKGCSSSTIQNMLEQLRPLYQEGEKLKMGQILVIGVPRPILSRFTYPCKRFGIPTGIPALDVVDRLSQSIIPKEGCQFRLMFCEETMSPDSGIEVVNLMDDEAVNKYCEGIHFDEPIGIPPLKDPIEKNPAWDEEGKNRADYAAFKLQVDQLLDKVFP